MIKGMSGRRNKNKNKRQAGARNAPAAGTSNKAVSGVVPSGRIFFVAAFVLSCIGIYAAIAALPPSFTQRLDAHTARALALVLNPLGITVSTAGDIVTDGKLALRIIPECTPLFMAGLFLCFVIFYPATVRQKAAGLLAGIPVLYLGNLVRLATIFMVSRRNPRSFDVVHVYFGQVFTIFMVLLACTLWLQWIDKEGPKRGIPVLAAGFLARFAIISGCMFLLWMKIHHAYVWLLDRFMIFGFSLFDYHLNPTRPTIVYYETFSIITFSALVLASRSMPCRTRARLLAAGLGFLFATHLLHRIDNTLLVLFNNITLLNVDLTLLLIGQFLLPGLLLFYLAGRNIREIPPEEKKTG